jgi:hypothetical protein
LFSRTAKILELCTKAPYLVQPRRENFGIATKNTVSCSAAQRKFWNCEQKYCILFSRATKNIWNANKSTVFVHPQFWNLSSKTTQKQLKLTAFSSAAARSLGISPTEATQIDCILFAEFANKNNSN